MLILETQVLECHIQDLPSNTMLLFKQIFRQAVACNSIVDFFIIIFWFHAVGFCTDNRLADFQVLFVLSPRAVRLTTAHALNP